MKERWLLGINKRIGTDEWLLVCAVVKLKQNTEKFRDLLFLRFPAFYSEYSLVWVSLPLSSKTGFTVLFALFSFWCFIFGIFLAIRSHMHCQHSYQYQHVKFLYLFASSHLKILFHFFGRVIFMFEGFSL